VVALASRNGVEMPIAEQIYAVLYEGKEPQQAAIDLLSRERKTE
jgi:glycerol-3-phosphate dehydrogenase (NAD(P)+)